MSHLAPLLARTLLLVAHPDDETMGCGALLQRIPAAMVVFATDGAPRDEYFWKSYGSRLRYARVREEEARQALAIAGVADVEFLAQRASGVDVFADQELHRNLPEAYRLIADAARRFGPQVLLTHAYEGGHPDHDACSFLTAVLAREQALPAYEFPLYHRMPSGNAVLQRFLVPDESEVVIEMTNEELAAKRAMVEAHRSQTEVLRQFDSAVERLRPMPAYDYSRPPHSGTLNYEAWGWPVTGADVCRAFADFLRARREQLQDR